MLTDEEKKDIYFKTTTEALDAVREWHREAMATDWSEEPF